jgi:uncharacterized delta-60 repeat protein
VQSDGKVLVGGNFSVVGSPTAFENRAAFARLNADGSLDTSFANLEINSGGEVRAIVVQSDGKILIGGSFTIVLGQSRKSVARLNANGTLDSLNVDVTDGAVNAIALAPNGQIYIGGTFTRVTNTYCCTRRVVRLNGDGTVDDTFDRRTLSGNVFSLAVQSDGKVLVGGDFDRIAFSGSQRGLARFNTDGQADFSFANPDIRGTVRAIHIRPDGKIVVAGSFTSVSFQSRKGVARLNANGSLDSGFTDPQVTTFPNGIGGSNVYAMVPMASGRLLIGGWIGSVGGQNRAGVALISS